MEFVIFRRTHSAENASSDVAAIIALPPGSGRVVSTQTFIFDHHGYDDVTQGKAWNARFFLSQREFQQILNSDFFKEDRKRIQSAADAKTYDLIIGNAPWGRNSLTPAAKEWSLENKWDTTYGNVGPLFLPKTAILAKPNGQIAMMQPAGILIFSQKEKAKAFRKRLFSEYKINEIVNLSALRFGLFKNSISPTCVITLTASPPDNDAFFYICPKPSRYSEDDYRVAIEPNDINSIFPYEGINDSLPWTALMWGGMRDLALVRRLRHQKNLGVLKEQGSIATRQGIIRTDRKKHQESIIGRRILNTKKFPENTILYLRAEELPVNDDPLTHSRDSTDYTAFEIPQLILKQSFQQENKRFQAALVQSDEDEGVLCSTGYVSVHAPKKYQPILETACLTYNSKLAVYFLLLSSGSFASYIPKINVEDLIAVPLPDKAVHLSEHVENFDLIDASIRQAFMIKESEWALIEDLFDYTLPDFKGDSNSSGRQKTFRSDKYRNAEPTLKKYCEYFIRVLKAGFGQDKQICATIFQEDTSESLPIRNGSVIFENVKNG